jgi:predicted nucleic acid-binding protein
MWTIAFSTMEALDKILKTLALPLLPLPKPALFLAGKAFAQYRRRGGAKQSVLADFFLGAHAAGALKRWQRVITM